MIQMEREIIEKKMKVHLQTNNFITHDNNIVALA